MKSTEKMKTPLALEHPPQLPLVWQHSGQQVVNDGGRLRIQKPNFLYRDEGIWFMLYPRLHSQPPGMNLVSYAW